MPPETALPATAGVRALGRVRIAAGQRWVYSAGFNTGVDLADTLRIDTELADLRRLAEAGARVALLSHQGSARDGSAVHLDHVARYLAQRLDRPVRYLPSALGPEAERAARDLAPGEIALFGNTRLLPGEQEADPELARRLALLGDQAAIGGFSKAHREHASNCGLLDHLPGYAAESLLAEIARLAPWAADGREQSRAAVLGGAKPEKTLIGLRDFARTHDLVIPGGVVLNCLLRALGYQTGASSLGERPDACVAQAAKVWTGRRRAQIHLPQTVLVRGPGWAGVREVRLAEGVPPDGAIVDFVLEAEVLRRLGAADRVIVAGPPSLCRDGHRNAADAVLSAVRHTPDRTLLLGGDTARELPWAGPLSAGGGSALQFLAEADCTVLRRLRRNAHDFRTASAEQPEA
jgi:phosphoglycerate kinase